MIMFCPKTQTNSALINNLLFLTGIFYVKSYWEVHGIIIWKYVENNNYSMIQCKLPFPKYSVSTDSILNTI